MQHNDFCYEFKMNVSRFGSQFLENTPARWQQPAEHWNSSLLLGSPGRVMLWLNGALGSHRNMGHELIHYFLHVCSDRPKKGSKQQVEPVRHLNESLIISWFCCSSCTVLWRCFYPVIVTTSSKFYKIKKKKKFQFGVLTNWLVCVSFLTPKTVNSKLTLH